MKTMQESWVEYRDKIYPKGISGVQNRECHQAFFCGALVIADTLNEVTTLPDNEAEAALKKLIGEVISVTDSIHSTMKDGN